MNRFLFLLFSFLLFSCSRVYAGSDTSGIVRFNIDNGFPSNNVYSLIKDHNGYLWFATENGVVKYNGYTTRVFNTNDGLPANDVWKLFEDNRGRIWLHSHAYEIGYIENDKYVTALKSTNQGMHPDYITSIDSNVMFLYKNGVAITLAIYNDTVAADISLTDICPFPLRTAFIDNNGKLCLVRVGGAIYVYNIFTNKLENKCKFRVDPYPYHFHVHFKPYSPFVLYGAQFKGKIFYKMNIKNCTVSTYDFEYLKIPKSESLHTWYIEGNKIVIITDKGVYIYSSTLKLLKAKKYKNIIGHLQLSAYHMYNNHEWYATVSSGLFAHPEMPDIFFKIDYPYNKDIQYIGSLKNRGDLWWNKNLNELIQISRKKDAHYILPKSYGDVTAFAQDSSSTLMVTTSSIYRIVKSYENAWNMKYLSTIVFNHPFGAENETDHVMRGDDSMKQNVLSGTSKIVNYAEDTFFSNTSYVAKRYIISRDSMEISNIDLNRFTDILMDRKNDLIWYYNNRKILAYNPRRNIYYHVNDKFLKIFGINNVYRLEFDSHAQLYIQDNDKIVVFDVSNGRYKTLKPPVNLSEAYLRLRGDTVLIAGRFGVMFGISYGAFKFNRFRTLPNNNFRYYNRLYEFVAGDKHLTFNTDKGILQTTARDLFNVTTAVNASSHDFFRVLINYPSTHFVSDSDTISMMRTSQKPGINFDVINFHGNGEVEYQYRIYGRSYNTGWQKTTSGEVFLGDLSPGTYYTLEYFAKDDLWRSPRQVAYLYIEPYWYQTPKWKSIFWVTGVVLIIALISITVFLTRYFVARTTAKKQSLVDMELRALYAQINPHFIFNTLGTALFFISKKRIDDAYVHVSKFSKLLRSYLSSSRKRYIILADEIDMLRNYIELQQIRFEEKFSYSIDVDNKVPAHSIQIPTLLLQPLVENAINHGLFHCSSGGFLFIRFLQGRDNTELICIIEDNGVGRQRAREIKQESTIQYESYGTQLTQELIEIFRKYEDMNIYLEYTDKTGEETGTVVKLTIGNLKYVA